MLDNTATRLGARDGLARRALWRRLVWLPVLGGPVAVVLILAHLQRLAAATHWNSDAAAPAVIVESSGGHGDVTALGEISSATTYFLFWATRALPDHRLVWACLPYLLALVGVGLLTWVSLVLAGRWAAGMTLTLATCVSTDVLFTQVAPAFHGTTWVSVALLAALLIARVDGRIRDPRRAAFVWCLVGLVTGAGIVSDPLLVIVGCLPFALAAVLHRRRIAGQLHGGATRVAALGAASVIVGAAGTLIVLRVAGMTTSRALRNDSYLPLAAPDEVVSHAAQAWRGFLALLGTGAGTGVPTGPGGWAITLVGTAALLLVAALGIRASATRSARPAAPRSAHDALFVFWGSATVLLLLADVFSDIPDPAAGTTNDRYLVPLVLAFAAVVPVWGADGQRRVPVAVGIGVLAIAALIPIAAMQLATERESGPHARAAPAIASWLASRSVDRGYSDYWDSLSLTYHTGLTVRAIERCGPSPGSLCPRILNARRSWYRPSGASRTFLLVNPTFGPGSALAQLDLPTVLGPPAASRRFGPTDVYVYDYDLATRLGGRWGA